MGGFASPPRSTYSAPVRKVISILLAGTLLAVSSLPLLPTTAMACPTGNMEHGAMQMQGGHQHHVAPVGDWQGCCIQCGCGCHRSIDSLPHLLAPHTVSLDHFKVDLIVEDASADAAPALQARLLVFPTPPPRQS
jgi:hypothetical protein